MTQKPLILAVETSGRIGSVAIAFGGQLLAEATFTGPMRHSAEIFPAVCGLLDRFSRKSEEIGHIYISVGPGSFTGLRIAVTLAKTMHLANAAKIVAVDTLDIIAANAVNLTTQNHEPQTTSHEKIATILDAKRGQFFIAVYQRNTSHRVWQKVLPDSLMTASDFLEQFAAADQPIWLLGEGLVYYKDKFKADGIFFLDEKYWRPRAEKVHLLGWQMALEGRFADALTLQPTYLRQPV
ncbi:MAG TPA: tRNA (adenosine(37)-N6)-threonylcarbamoyltransferase complex dimerization subunit type 1 TsaB [Phycisphaerales bacterium]|nr:tRNA (adenosine(37)-N6)-threonylcarbamoyltransferase complex dimerization subunit type 1 TsaB [Phycisphaerales bacterium]